MNVSLSLAVIAQHVLTLLMDTIAHVLLGTMTHTAKMVKHQTNWHNCASQILEINECESLPCSNGATCLNIVDGYHCTCAPGYNDTHCKNGK